MPKNHNKQWTPADEAKLKGLVKQNTPTGLLAWKLGRTETAVYNKASELGVSVKPVNQSPYNRQKK
jgi:hypothetical protein